MQLNIIPKPNKAEFFGGEVWIKDLPVRYETNDIHPEEYYCLEIKKGAREEKSKAISKLVTVVPILAPIIIPVA